MEGKCEKQFGSVCFVIVRDMRSTEFYSMGISLNRPIDFGIETNAHFVTLAGNYELL